MARKMNKYAALENEMNAESALREVGSYLDRMHPKFNLDLDRGSLVFSIKVVGLSLNGSVYTADGRKFQGDVAYVSGSERGNFRFNGTSPQSCVASFKEQLQSISKGSLSPNARMLTRTVEELKAQLDSNLSAIVFIEELVR